MRGNYVAEPRLLSWLRERTVLFKSEHELSTTIVANNYTEIFAFAAQSSLSKVRNDNAVRTRGTCAVPTRYGSICAAPHTQTSSRNRYSGTVTTVPCRTNHDITDITYNYI